jgi:3'(2'), 5'-bisphosphate nucleotidase
MSLTSENWQLALAGVALKAGAVLLDYYRPGVEVAYKQDGSPVTAADRDAEALILAELNRLAPGIPVIAEEAVSSGRMDRAASRFFLVDPLDGTKEFIKRNGEFTVNIALIDDGVPRFGVIYAPVPGDLYFTPAPDKAVSAAVRPDAALQHTTFKSVHVRPWNAGTLTAAVSRSHNNDETEQYLRELGVAETVTAGSSLKFCLVAAGRADVYPRFGRTWEWDTAAGDAILRAAGGSLLTQTGEPMVYGKREEGYLNPGFIAWGRRTGT